MKMSWFRSKKQGNEPSNNEVGSTSQVRGSSSVATKGCNAGNEDELLTQSPSGKFTEHTCPSSDSLNASGIMNVDGDDTSLTKAGTGSNTSNNGEDNPIVELRNGVAPGPPESFLDHEIIVESDLRPESRHRRRWIRSFGSSNHQPTTDMKVCIENTSNHSKKNEGIRDHLHDEDENGIEVDCASTTGRGHKRPVWCSWCSRNGLFVWAVVATILLFINLAVTSGMFKRNNEAEVSGLAMGQTACANGYNNNNNNTNNNANIVATNSTTANENNDRSDEKQTENNNNDKGSTTNSQSTSGNSKPITTTNKTSVSSNRCGCKTCSENVWNKPVGNPASTCGQRVEYLMSAYGSHFPTEIQACRQIAFEFPCDCGSCDPNRCGLYKEEFVAPDGWSPKDDYSVPSTPVPKNIDGTYSMYCYPPEGQRISYTNAWNNGYTIEVKQGLDNPICGPGDNRFVPDNVIYDTTNAALKLQYKNAAAGEVRVTLPNDEKFTYGTYKFEIGSITVSNSAGEVLSNVLPKELVFGLFTWDDTEDYAIHENFNHEVDIEISRWNCETNSDLQFLVQPPGYPQMQRFFSGGENNKYSQQNQVYEFTWGPGQIDWYSSAGNGQEFTLKTEEALYMDIPDYVQCMPDRGMQTEVRINLWNMLGAVQPVSMASDDVVEVVISNFTFTPLTGPLYVKDGGFCTKHCQCNYPSSTCDGGICTPSSSS